MKNVYITVGNPALIDGLDSTNPSSAAAIGLTMAYHVVSTAAEAELDSGTLNISGPPLTTQAGWRIKILLALATKALTHNWIILSVVFPDYTNIII